MLDHSRSMLFWKAEIDKYDAEPDYGTMLIWVKLPCPRAIDFNKAVTKLITRSGLHRSCGSHTMFTSDKV